MYFFCRIFVLLVFSFVFGFESIGLIQGRGVLPPFDRRFYYAMRYLCMILRLSITGRFKGCIMISTICSLDGALVVFTCARNLRAYLVTFAFDHGMSASPKFTGMTLLIFCNIMLN